MILSPGNRKRREESSFIAIAGACHCGNLRFELDWPAAETEIPVRMCGCTFCQKHKGAWTSNRRARLRIALADQTQVSRYNFGTQTADFLVCSVCGAAPVVTCEIDSVLYAVVNVNTFVDIGDFSLSSSPTDFDGEDTGSRLERRKRNWIPCVRFDGK